ncbi:hypothetical protein [Bradyrhizobium cenepequi]|uniref:hypothetical protein n=1 Tax=Bradyrhizobium cenepequi TaxID=2821403 RepID=UPI001CE3A844|nr:hypothetical protein [Bradyrhizobium cenepequi]
MAERNAGWGRKFNEPITLRDGRRLVVLRDAANYVTALPESEANAPEWQPAADARRLSRLSGA